jgi:hypothetical protein
MRTAHSAESLITARLKKMTQKPGIPAGSVQSRRQLARETEAEAGCTRESEGPVVATKRGNE